MLKSFGDSFQKSDTPLAFSKMSGAGNDFVVIDNRGGGVGDAAELARRICTRRLSVGADGIILVENSARATFRMRYLNSDGSVADFCGNGTRCAARFAFLNVIAPRRMTIETDAGIISAEVRDNDVTLGLPDPDGFRSRMPLKVGETDVRGSFILVGVPHYVIFIREGLWAQDITPLGRSIRTHPALHPDGANVDFVLVRDRGSIEVRTYERGVEAETLACGSGVVASVAVSALFGKVDSPVSVLTRGGIRLSVSCAVNETAGHRSIEGVRLAGDARLVFRAQLTPETVEGFDPVWVRDPTNGADHP